MTAPQPPRPSDPSLRAAGMMRPRATSSHDLNDARNQALLIEAVRRLSEGQAEQANINKAIMEHAARMEHALGVAEESDGDSDPPPATARRRKPTKKLDTIELDSIKAKYGVYVFFLIWVVDKFAEHFHLFGAK